MQGKQKLYSGAKTVLRQLKSAGHNLIFLSNCKHSYMQAHREQLGLEQYFSSFYCTEDFNFAQKWRIAELILAELSGRCIVIGDRRQDIEIALRHQLLSKSWSIVEVFVDCIYVCNDKSVYVEWKFQTLC